MFLLVVFAVTLAGRVRRGERWIAATVGGAAVAAVGLVSLASFDLILATDTKDGRNPAQGADERRPSNRGPQEEARQQ